jgi:taurine dioxygenase
VTSLLAEPLEPFGVAVRGIDLRDLDDDGRRLDELFAKHSLVVIRGQVLTDDEQVAFASRFGSVLDEGGGHPFSYIAHDPERQRSGLGADIPQDELSFHRDQMFTTSPPVVQILHPLALPTTGGETVFVHGGDAFAALPAETRQRLEGLTAIHLYDPRVPLTSGRYRESIVGPGSFHAEHPVIAPHPFGAGDVLTVTYQHTDRIVGLPPGKSDALLAELFAVLYAPERVYRHEWRSGDVVVWDNRVVQHGRGTFDRSERRVMRRCVVGSPEGARTFVEGWRALVQPEL